jgi:hypothetical protein
VRALGLLAGLIVSDLECAATPGTTKGDGHGKFSPEDEFSWSGLSRAPDSHRRETAGASEVGTALSAQQANK